MKTKFYNQKSAGSMNFTGQRSKLIKFATCIFIYFLIILECGLVEARTPVSRARIVENITNETSGNATLGDFLTYKGCALLASYAHPTNTFKYADWKIYDDRIWVDIYYEDNFNTTLEIARSGSLFTNIRVLYDNDFVNPFTFTQWIKDQIMKGLRNNNTSTNSSAGAVGQYLQKTLEDMSGRDFTCVCFTAAWWDY